MEFGLDEEKEGGMRHLADHVFVLSAKMKTGETKRIWIKKKSKYNFLLLLVSGNW